MKLLTYLPLLILFYFSLKLLLKFIDENIISIKEQIKLRDVEKGFLSIRDIQKNNYDRFINTINLYLSTHNYENIIFQENNTQELTNITGILNNENIYISCIQNDLIDKSLTPDDNCFILTSKEDIQMFLGRMLKSQCKKGLLITSTTFSEDAISFVKLNNQYTNNEIKLIDGYELTKAFRIYKNYVSSTEVNDETR